MNASLVNGTSSLQIADQRTVDQRLLMFAFHFPPANTTGAHRPFRFVRYLQELGIETHVVTSAPQTQDAPWKHSYATGPATTGMERAGLKAATALQRVLPYNDQLPWVTQAIARSKDIVKREQPSAIISTSPPVACHLAAWAAKQLYRLPWVADFRDPIRGNPFRSRSWGGIWDVPVERLILSSADAVVANTDAAANMLRKRYPAFAHKVHLIWNGYDPAKALKPKPIPSRSHKSLVHAGSIYGQRHPSSLVASLNRLATKAQISAETVRLRLVGDIAFEEPWVAASSFTALHEQGLIEHTNGSVSASEALREIAEADYLLLLDVNNAGAGLQVPAKIFEYIQIGRPILTFTSRNSPVERLLDRSGAPHLCIYPDQKPEEVDSLVLAFLGMPTNPVEPGTWFQQEFDGRAQAQKLAQILATTIAASRTRS
jgi:glycosyltransferase involved in cell wall biosynthesis